MSKKKNILITGATGQLGQEFLNLLPLEDFKVKGFSSKELDVTNAHALEVMFQNENPDILINCAAYTAVDKAEVEVERCNQVNAQALKVIGNLALEYKVNVLHFSTDYVFGGSGNQPWAEENETAPISIYGATKREGELALLESECRCLILRVSWLYSEFGSNFPKTINRLLSERENLNVVFDQVSSPTWSRPLVEFVIHNLHCNADFFNNKIYHYSEEGQGSWYDMAEIINETHQKELTAVSSHEFIQAAKRPAYSKLDNTLAKSELGLAPDEWQYNLRKFLKIIQ
ncbi:MAG: dTDP-4-dehydrorhamnose reductase [Flavobacteriales bacterium]